jgi:hypothetical protein
VRSSWRYDHFVTVLSGGTQQALIGTTLDWTIGARNRVAMAWRANDFAMVANGGTPALDTNGALPVGPSRLMIGAHPMPPPVRPTTAMPSVKPPTSRAASPTACCRP